MSMPKESVKSYRIAHRQFRNGEVAVRIKSNGYVVPLRKANSKDVIEVLGVYSYGNIKPLKLTESANKKYENQ